MALDPFSKFHAEWKVGFTKFDPKVFEAAHFGFIDFIVRIAFERDDPESFHADDPRMVPFFALSSSNCALYVVLERSAWRRRWQI